MAGLKMVHTRTSEDGNAGNTRVDLVEFSSLVYRLSRDGREVRYILGLQHRRIVRKQPVPALETAPEYRIILIITQHQFVPSAPMSV